MNNDPSRCAHPEAHRREFSDGGRWCRLCGSLGEVHGNSPEDGEKFLEWLPPLLLGEPTDWKQRPSDEEWAAFPDYTVTQHSGYGRPVVKLNGKPVSFDYPRDPVRDGYRADHVVSRKWLWEWIAGLQETNHRNRYEITALTNKCKRLERCYEGVCKARESVARLLDRAHVLETRAAEIVKCMSFAAEELRAYDGDTVEP